MSEQTSDFYEFGRFRVKSDERVLLRGEDLVPLTPKAFDILLALLENDGRIVNKDDLMKKVWPNTFVEEGNLTQNVSLLRKALGESANGPQFIETVPRRGYRFIAQIQCEGPALAEPVPIVAPASTPKSRSPVSARFWAVAVFFVAVSCVVAIWAMYRRKSSRICSADLGIYF